jgi:hypothetical protein
MATNTGDGYRRGSVSDRSQFKGPSDTWYKRDSDTGRIIDGKKSDGPYKGVAKEPDGRKG